MEPPFKRRRVSGSSYPEIDLHARRAQNDFRLKSIFESIFDKYGRDFDGIGDEIDMKTGEIVVNNGHILGMTNERDTGGAECSSEELKDSVDGDEGSLVDYSEEHLTASGTCNPGDAAVRKNSEASEQSDFDADSLMGDVPAESHLQQLGKRSRRPVLIPSDDEEDELASSDIEWASHSKDRLGAQERLCFLGDKPAFADEPGIEPPWRAPPLPSNALFNSKRDVVGHTSVDKMRECSDDEQAGISLWTPEVRRRPRRRRGSANSLGQRSLSFALGLEKNAGGLRTNLICSEPAARRVVRWTHEEEMLLIHLKTTTNLTGAAMESYFPKRQGNAIASHWNYMITRSNASPKLQEPTIAGRITPPSSLSPSINSLALDEPREKSFDQDAFRSAQNPQIVQRHTKRRIPGARNSGRSSGKLIEPIGDHHEDSQYDVGDNHEIPNGNSADESILISDDDGAHSGYTLGEPFSSAGDCETKEDLTMDYANEPSAMTADHYHPTKKLHNRSGQSPINRNQEGMRRNKRSDPPQAFARLTSEIARHVDRGYQKAESAYQSNSNSSYVNTDQSYSLSKSLEIEDDVVKRRCASTIQGQGLEFVFENSGGARLSCPTTSIKAEPDIGGVEYYRDGTVGREVPLQCTTATEDVDSPKRLSISRSALQREEPIPRTAEDIIRRKSLMPEEPQKTGSTNLTSTSSAQRPDHGKSSASYKPNDSVTSKTFPKRQVVQVVIPLTATNNVITDRGDTKRSPTIHPRVKSPLTTMETGDPAFIRQLPATAKSAPADLSPGSLPQEILTIRDHTRSPSVAPAESQYAAAAAFALNDVRSPLGPEIADSQSLSTTPIVANPAPELGAEATRPIILDSDSPPSRMTPGVAPSARKQSKQATKATFLDSDSQPSQMTPGIATPARKRIEEATESDIVESGCYPLGKPLSAARSPSKEVKEIAAESFSSIWTAVDDYSEDELTYL